MELAPKGDISQPRVETAGERLLLAVSPEPWVAGPKSIKR